MQKEKTNTGIEINTETDIPNTQTQPPHTNPIEPYGGYSPGEQNDPNSITVTVRDPKTPIVVFYGPPSCGKTMTLIRLVRYLQEQNYTVVPEKTFRPTSDKHYEQLCANFDTMINSNTAAESTSNISFMLVKVFRKGKPICQLLEAPGEYYFKPDEPCRPYPPYVQQIITSPNRKVWAVMLEPDWNDSEPRTNYVTRIKELRAQMHPRDKVIFVYNKIDKTQFIQSAGRVNTNEAIKDVQNLYPNIFVPFENQNPITKFFIRYNCEFVPFMTGTYSKTITGGFTFTMGHPIFVRKLWQAMLKLLK